MSNKNLIKNEDGTYSVVLWDSIKSNIKYDLDSIEQCIIVPTIGFKSRCDGRIAFGELDPIYTENMAEYMEIKTTNISHMFTGVECIWPTEDKRRLVIAARVLPMGPHKRHLQDHIDNNWELQFKPRWLVNTNITHTDVISIITFDWYYNAPYTVCKETL